jgi:hypothetical protein
MLLVRFGFLHIWETWDGLLPENHRPLNNLKGNHYDTTNRTADRLHAKIMKIFGESSCRLSKHYEPTVLLCPELSLEKTRRALSYFVQFCIFSRDCRKEIKAKNQEAIQIKLRRDALKSTNELLRLKVQDEEARAEELEAKLQEKSGEYEAKIKEAEIANNIVEELNMNTKIKEAKNELEALLKLKTQINKAPIAIETAASNGCSTSSAGLSLPSERGMRKRKRCGSSDYGCKKMAAELAHMKGTLVETEQFLERTIKLKKRFGKAESQLKTEKARQKMEELNYNRARELIVRVKTLEKELEINEKQHTKIMEGMRSKLAAKEGILWRETQRNRELGKKSVVVKGPTSKWKQLTNPEKNNFQSGSN